MNRVAYKTYLASREWAVLKEQVRERSGDICERCLAAPYQETHHLTYERTGSERLDDLLAVCSPCHAYVSAKSTVDPCNVPRAPLRTRELPKPVVTFNWVCLACKGVSPSASRYCFDCGGDRPTSGAWICECCDRTMEGQWTMLPSCRLCGIGRRPH